MVTIVPEIAADAPAREALLDSAFGPKRRRKTSERLREGRVPAEGLAFSARDEAGGLIGTLRLWDVEAGTAGAALLLGPLAVDSRCRNQGVGGALIRHAMVEAGRLGHASVLLVGDEGYYGRFGFSRDAASGLRLPGPVDLPRFLGAELRPDALANATGILRPTGHLTTVPDARRLAA